jgi:hypothetical protein
MKLAKLDFVEMLNYGFYSIYLIMRHDRDRFVARTSLPRGSLQQSRRASLTTIADGWVAGNLNKTDLSAELCSLAAEMRCKVSCSSCGIFVSALRLATAKRYYLRLLPTSLKTLDKLLPTVFTAEIITTAIKEAMRRLINADVEKCSSQCLLRGFWSATAHK